MFSKTIDHIYSEAEWHTLERAHQRACRLLNRDPKYHPLAERVARTIMIFFDRGETDFGRLANMTVKRELYLFEIRVTSDIVFTPPLNRDVPKYLH